MLKQKFKRGNLVHIIEGSCPSYFEQGVDAIILGSYADFHGSDDIFQYVVMFPDSGGQCAWYDDNQLALVDVGGEHLIENAIENGIKIEACHILLKENIDHLGQNEIITLLRFIGFDYSISNNYFKLWEEMLPLFKEIRGAETPLLLKGKYPEYDIEEVWNIFHEN